MGAPDPPPFMGEPGASPSPCTPLLRLSAKMVFKLHENEWMDKIFKISNHDFYFLRLLESKN